MPECRPNVATSISPGFNDKAGFFCAGTNGAGTSTAKTSIRRVWKDRASFPTRRSTGVTIRRSARNQRRTFRAVGLTPWERSFSHSPRTPVETPADRAGVPISTSPFKGVGSNRSGFYDAMKGGNHEVSQVCAGVHCRRFDRILCSCRRYLSFGDVIQFEALSL